MRRRRIAHAIAALCGLGAILALGPAVHGQGDESPVALADGAYVVAQGGTLTVATPGVLANDSGAAPLTAVLSRDVQHGTLSLGADGSFSYSHDGSGTTADSFRYRAHDGVLESPEATVTLAVTAPHGARLEVPADYGSIQDALDAASSGDLILVAPGTYEEELTLTKAVTLASWFVTTGDASYIDTTILDGEGHAAAIEVPSSAEDGATIAGLTIQNSDDGLSVRAQIHLVRNHIRWTRDGVDYEDGSGGTCRYNLFEENIDDGIDPDSAVDIVIEHNTIRNNGGDGIEIRLQPYTGPMLDYVIRHNLIYGNEEDGIQLIDYDVLTDRRFEISHNAIYDNAQAGLGMMSGANTREDYEGASIEERILVLGNTFRGNNHGMTGGDNAIVLNNLFVGHPVLAMKNVDGNSEVAFNLFYDNGTDAANSNLDVATTFSADPLLDPELALLAGSPAIDAGTDFYVFQGETVLDLDASGYAGAAPDLGAFEWLPSGGAGPEAPELVQPLEGAGDVPLSPTLRWLGTADSYQLQIANALDFLSIHQVYDLVTFDPGLEHTVGFGVLDHSTGYFWRVRGSDAGGLGSWSAVRTFTTEAPSAPPEAPLLTSPWTGATGVELEPPLTWLGAAELFRVQLATDPGFAALVLDSSVAAKSLVPGPGVLAHATIYHWRVRGENTFGPGPWSAPSAFTTRLPGLPLPPPWNLRSPSQTETSIDLEWETQADPRVVAYAIYRNGEPLASESEPDHQAVSLLPGTLYHFRVTAVDADGNQSAASTELGVWTSMGSMQPVSLGVQISTGDDDAEERISEGGAISLRSSSLQLTEDGSRLQAVGLRFQGIDVPQGATILGAHVQFNSNAIDSTATRLSIEGEASDDAAAFARVDGDVTSRPRTSQSVDWDPPPWESTQASGPDQRTPELSPLVQEIVDRPGWSAGNALALVISGSGTRSARSYDGTPARAAVFEVDYLDGCQGDADGDGFPCGVDCDDSDPSVRPGAAERCDGRDNDCDNSVDENDAIDAALWYADFDGDGYGDSGQTTSACTQPTGWGMDSSDCNDADASVHPGASEICNGRDDDCDGSPDDSSCASLSLSVQVAAGDDDAEERISEGGAISLGSSSLQLTEDGSRLQAVGLRFRDVDLPPGAAILGARIQFTADAINSTTTSLTIEGEASDDADGFVRVDGNVTSRPRTSQVVAWNPPAWTSQSAGADQRTPELTALVQEIVNRPGWSSGNALVFVLSGSGTRTARSYDGTPGEAAILEVEYAEGCQGDADGDGFSCNVDCNDDDASVHPGAVDLCDGIDNDCDGEVDEDYAPQSCATGDLGICAAGTTLCQGGSQTCQADELPQAEICDDGLDNDCDGDTDAQDLSCGGSLALTVQVAAGDDDAEERISEGGAINLTSADLELTEDGSRMQVLGLRFRDVDIPREALVLGARVQFTADETDSEATSLTIEGEASDDAAAFVKVDGNVTSRPRTSQAVAWAPPPWTSTGASGPDQRTPELTALVQEIVNRPGWSSGNALALVISGSGHRTAEAYDGVPGQAATLEVEYAEGCQGDADGDGFPCNVDCNDDDASIYPGAVDLCDGIDNDCDGGVDEDYAPQSCVTGDPGICGPGTTRCEAGAPICEPDQLPQAEICDDGLDNDCDGDTDLEDEASCTAVPVSAQVNRGDDDAEEWTSTGNMSLTSGDLELTEDGNKVQVVGLRFRNVALPAGVTILGARIQFTAAATDSTATSLTLEGEDSDDADVFSKSKYDLTSRPRTGASVDWDPPAWTSSGASGSAQRSPELTAVVQEIVDRPGWSSGNALVLLISGSGHRTAEAYNGDSDQAPVLEVEYLSSTP